jgi:hypothetical protein
VAARHPATNNGAERVLHSQLSQLYLVSIAFAANPLRRQGRGWWSYG